MLAIGALLLTGAGIVLSTVARRQHAAARLLVTTHPLVALAGLLGLLFDYRDGPVRTVQLIVYLLLVLAVVRLGRIVASLANHDTDATNAAQAVGLRPPFPVEERALRLRVQTDCGHPNAQATSGLIAYCDAEPVGWCAVEPRVAYEGLVRNQRVPWEGRDEVRADADVWAITCLLARPGNRRRGVGTALVHAAIDHAHQHGAHALEAYPMTTSAAIDEELHVGLLNMYLDAGMIEICRPTKRRAVVRIDLAQ